MVMPNKSHTSTRTSTSVHTSRLRPPLAAWLKGHYRLIWWFVFLGASYPAVALGIRTATDQLGANPLQALEQQTGLWTLILLIITLSITPLRRSLSLLSKLLHSHYGKRLSDWNWVIRLRRMLGLYVFYYATLHLGVFLHFDISWDVLLMIEEVREKPFLLVGSLCFILLIPLAITTPVAAMRRLGKYWRPLHRSIYVIAILAVLHFMWAAKSGDSRPWTYAGIVAFLLIYRLFAHYGWGVRKPLDDGMEISERPKHYY